MTNNTASVGAKLGISLTLEFKDKDGNVLKRMPMAGSVPLEDTGMSVEQAQSFINEQKEDDHGNHTGQ